jgi:hypothetical protein
MTLLSKSFPNADQVSLRDDQVILLNDVPFDVTLLKEFSNIVNWNDLNDEAFSILEGMNDHLIKLLPDGGEHLNNYFLLITKYYWFLKAAAALYKKGKTPG